jgi:hypothetical protein
MNESSTNYGSEDGGRSLQQGDPSSQQRRAQQQRQQQAPQQQQRQSPRLPRQQQQQQQRQSDPDRGRPGSPPDVQEDLSHRDIETPHGRIVRRPVVDSDRA